MMSSYRERRPGVSSVGAHVGAGAQDFAAAIRTSSTARALLRNRKLILLIAIPSLLFAPIMSLVALGASHVALGPVAASAAVSAVAVFSWRAYLRRRDVTKHPLIELIREHPDQIVWVFVMRQQTTTGRTLQEMVHVRALPSRYFVLYSLEASQVIAELAAWCPHAHVGWSKALEQAWERDPASLRRTLARTEVA